MVPTVGTARAVGVVGVEKRIVCGVRNTGTANDHARVAQFSEQRDKRRVGGENPSPCTNRWGWASLLCRGPPSRSITKGQQSFDVEQ